MKIKEYVKKRYGRNGCVVSRLEAEAFGITYPLTKGWLFIHGEAFITPYMEEKLRAIGRYKSAIKDPRRKVPRYSQTAMDEIDKKRKKHIEQINKAIVSENFYSSMPWRILRMKVLVKYGAVCQCCGASKDHGAVMHVDHIKPRSKYPELSLRFSNLQILCEACNVGKLNIDQTDWRKPAEPLPIHLEQYSEESIGALLRTL